MLCVIRNAEKGCVRADLLAGSPRPVVGVLASTLSYSIFTNKFVLIYILIGLGIVVKKSKKLKTYLKNSGGFDSVKLSIKQ